MGKVDGLAVPVFIDDAVADTVADKDFLDEYDKEGLLDEVLVCAGLFVGDIVLAWLLVILELRVPVLDAVDDFEVDTDADCVPETVAVFELDTELVPVLVTLFVTLTNELKVLFAEAVSVTVLDDVKLTMPVYVDETDGLLDTVLGLEGEPLVVKEYIAVPLLEALAVTETMLDFVRLLDITGDVDVVIEPVDVEVLLGDTLAVPEVDEVLLDVDEGE